MFIINCRYNVLIYFFRFRLFQYDKLIYGCTMAKHERVRLPLLIRAKYGQSRCDNIHDTDREIQFYN